MHRNTFHLCALLHTMTTPKGTLLLIGGHEDKSAAEAEPDAGAHMPHAAHFRILGELIAKTPRAHHDIQVIATASSIPEEMEALYREAYRAAGFAEVSIIHIAAAEDAARADFITRIHYAHAVFFTGGDQLRLTAMLHGSAVLEAIRKKYYADPNFIVAGTSAGAMAVPEHMIGRGRVQEALLKADLAMGKGFGLISGIIADTHFIRRGRFGRLALAVALHPGCTGIGLGEDAALIIRGGNEAESTGSGMVVLIDGSSIGLTNAARAGDYDPVVIENLRVHILAPGTKYLIQDKKFLPGNTRMQPTNNGTPNTAGNADRA